jgi:hypothetical protein
MDDTYGIMIYELVADSAADNVPWTVDVDDNDIGGAGASSTWNWELVTKLTLGPLADPTTTMRDSDDAAGTAKFYGISHGGANDIIMYLGVEDSGGDSPPTNYVEIDGVTETIDLLKPVVTSSTSNLSAGAVTLGTVSGSIDAGGATSFEIPNGEDSDVTVAGQISNDTDGANETGDVIVRAFDGTNQWPVGKKIECIDVTLIEPDGMDAADLIPIWANTSGMTFTIVEIQAWSDDDDVTFEVEELTNISDFTAITTVDAVDTGTTGTSVSYVSETTITHAAIEHDHLLAIDFDATDTPDYLKVTICGWFNADVD